MIGYIGAGNMATALARGWGEPVLVTDTGSGRARSLVAELGGRVARDNAELAAEADIIVLAHPPHLLREVAERVDASGKLVISVLGATTTAQLRRAYPNSRVARTMPNTPVEIRKGVTCIAEGGEAVVSLFQRVGHTVVLPEALMDVATATAGVMPAYVALLSEACIDAAVCYGMPTRHAAEMFLHTLAGTAELILSRGGDTLAVRREVASPGESTVRGLAALERHGIRAAFNAAAHDVLARLSMPYDGRPALL